MGSPPQPPTPSSFSPFGPFAAAPPGRDGSTADSFPFHDNRDEKQKEGILEIIKISDVVSEKAARHDETCLAQVADEEEGSAHNLRTLARPVLDFFSVLKERARESNKKLREHLDRILILGGHNWLHQTRSYASSRAEPNTRTRADGDPTVASSRAEPNTRTRADGDPTSSCAHWATAQFSPHCQFEHEAILAAASRKRLRKRVEICPTRWLAPFASSPTNPGGVAESETSLLLDSGASFHAVGDVNLLTDPVLFPTDMRGVAVCADEWLTDPVLFPNDMRGVAVCADGTHLRTLQKVGFSIPDVRYVDGLKKNLISVSQLDKDHGLCCCFHTKKCEVMLADGTVVGGAILQDDGMYKLSFLEVPAKPEE